MIDTLSSPDFQKLRELIYSESGINLNADKQTMVETRLRKRMHALDFHSFNEYCRFVFKSASGTEELVHLIDAVTTNKTDFFREPGHFDYLLTKALPEIGQSRKLLVWSAGCSSGEEPYTLAMLLSEYAQTHPGFHFSILATDICTAVLDKARRGVYREELTVPVPQELKRKYFMRSRDPSSDLLRVVPELRALVEFRRVNFVDADLGVAETPQIIFCRNVIIYFDRTTQERVLGKLLRQLSPGGYFFAGHSESLQGMDLPLIAAGPCVYRKSR